MENPENSKKSHSGIPEAVFLDDLDAFMGQQDNSSDKVLRKLEEQFSKYKFMEMNLMSKKKRLQLQIPDLTKSFEMVDKLKDQNDDIYMEFLLSEQAYIKACVPPSKTVYLWLGANVMLEFSLEEAQELLKSSISTAVKNLGFVEHDLDFLRDQFTTTEVNMARVFNWDVKRRQSAKISS